MYTGKQKGGMKLNDFKSGTFRDIIQKHLLNNYNIFADPILHRKSYEPLKILFSERIKYLNSETYTNIIKILIKSYYNDEQYDQLFYDSTGNIIEMTRGMKPYHTNIASLIFMSFLFEFELIALYHHLIPYNTQTKPTMNLTRIADWEMGVTTNNRIYRDSIETNPEKILDTFTSKLDEIFENFMKTFATKCAEKFGMKYEDIYKTIVPINHIEHIPNTFDFIYVNWKDRLCENDDTKIRIINRLLHKTMQHVEDNFTEYTADGTGFFSFIYLLSGDHKRDYYGSCVTYSMLELFIMSALHTNGENMTLVLESAHPQEKHKIWKLTQTLLGITSVTHWVTEYTLFEHTRRNI